MHPRSNVHNVHSDAGKRHSNSAGFGRPPAKDAKAAQEHSSPDHGLYDLTSETLDWLQNRSDNAQKIAEVLRRGLSVVLAHPNDGTTRNVLRRARVVLWWGRKDLGKISDHLETMGQLAKLTHNVYCSLPTMNRIIHSSDSWDTKTGRLGAEFAAVSLKTVAQLGLDSAHEIVQTARTGAAMLGVDVTHPKFGNHSALDPRTWVSWQAVNFMDARLNYLSERVYSGENIYVFLHTHVSEPHDRNMRR